MPAITDLTRIAKRYASALFDLAQEKNKLDAVEKDLAAFAAALVASDELEDFLSNPLLKKVVKVKASEAILKKIGSDALTVQFFGVLANHNRLPVVAAVIEEFRSLLAAHRGVLEAEVMLALPASDATLKTIAEALKKATGREVTIKAKVDPELLGGMAIRMGGRTVDATLKHKLERLRQKMKVA